MCATERERAGLRWGSLSLSPASSFFSLLLFPDDDRAPPPSYPLSPLLSFCVCCSSFLYQLRRKPLSSFFPPPRPPRSLVGSRKREEERRRRPHKQGKTAGAERRPPPPPLLSFPPKSTHLKHPQLNQQHALIPPPSTRPRFPQRVSPPLPPLSPCAQVVSLLPPHLFRPPLFLFHRPFSGGREGRRPSLGAASLCSPRQTIREEEKGAVAHSEKEA